MTLRDRYRCADPKCDFPYLGAREKPDERAYFVVQERFLAVKIGGKHGSNRVGFHQNTGKTGV